MFLFVQSFLSFSLRLVLDLLEDERHSVEEGEEVDLEDLVVEGLEEEEAVLEVVLEEEEEGVEDLVGEVVEEVEDSKHTNVLNEYYEILL